MDKTVETKASNKEKVTVPQTPQVSGNKETKYCTLLQSVEMEDKENGYTYAMEKIHIKDLGRDEIRLCLYFAYVYIRICETVQGVFLIVCL